MKLLSTTTVVGLGLFAILILSGGESGAFSQYSFEKNDNFPPPAAPGYNGCRTCHGDFNAVDTEMSGQTWPSNLMDTHVDFMVGDGDCTVCHSSGPRFPVALGASAGGNQLEPISCSGCHGRAEDGTPSPDDGSAGYGLGLRRHHWNANVTIDLDPDPVGELLVNTRLCGAAGCHADADPASGLVPVGEHVKPPYYADPEGGGSTVLHPPMPSDPCNDPSNADEPEEEKVGDLLALDNDGDLAYDLADSNCTTVASAPPPVADGVTGTVMTLNPGVGPDELVFDIDNLTCSDDHAVVLYGNIGDFSGYQGAVDVGCDIGAGQNATVTHVGSNLWFNVIWVSADSEAGSPGSATSGTRTWTAIGLCGVTADNPTDDVCN